MVFRLVGHDRLFIVYVAVSFLISKRVDPLNEWHKNTQPWTLENHSRTPKKFLSQFPNATLTKMSCLIGELIGSRMVYWNMSTPFRLVFAQRHSGVNLVNVSLGNLAQYLLTNAIAVDKFTEALVESPDIGR